MSQMTEEEVEEGVTEDQGVIEEEEGGLIEGQEVQDTKTAKGTLRNILNTLSRQVKLKETTLGAMPKFYL